MASAEQDEVRHRIAHGLACSGSATGAGSVVSRDVPPMVVAVGAPARVARAITDDDLTTRVR